MSEDRQPISLEGSLVGRWVQDEYLIVRYIARGGMGEVYLAEQVALGRLAAIKVLYKDNARDSQISARFQREGKLVSQLNHPGIVTVYNFGQLDEERLFLAMEYVEGSSLHEMLSRGPLPPAAAALIALQCADSLAFAHERNIVHRDFKPANVMVSPGPPLRTKILDFGISRLTEGSSLTQTGALLGTPRYMSPEQCRGEAATPRSDQYALGLVLHEMLTGQPAFQADSPVAYLFLHQEVTPPPPSAVTGGAALRAFDDLVMRMVRKDPAERFPDLRAVCQVLEALADPAAGKTLIATEGEPAPSDRTIAEFRGRALLEAGTPVLDEPARILLEAAGFAVTARCPEPAGLRAGDGPEELVLLGLPEVCADLEWLEWVRRGLPAKRTLACLSAEAAPVDLLGHCRDISHLLWTPRPIEPLVLCIGLGCMIGADPLVELPFLEARGTQELLSSRSKTLAIDTMVRAMLGAGVRRAARHALQELSEEMLMNALFDAPVDARGEPLYASLDRRADVDLPADRKVRLRWALSERFAVLSVRDSYGSLTATKILHHVSSGGTSPLSRGSARGAGIGLAIIGRVAQHLVFAVRPGEACEVIALVARDLGSGSATARSICVVQRCDHRERKIGKQLRLTETIQLQQRLIRLEGYIDETSDLSAIFERGGVVRLDLSGVTGVNSTGVKAWLDAHRDSLDPPELLFERCSPPVARQLNMIPALLKTGRVVSIQAPYYCPACNAETLELLHPEDTIDQAPSRRCGACGGELEFDEIPEQYLVCLTAGAAPTLPDFRGPTDRRR